MTTKYLRVPQFRVPPNHTETTGGINIEEDFVDVPIEKYRQAFRIESSVLNQAIEDQLLKKIATMRTYSLASAILIAGKEIYSQPQTFMYNDQFSDFLELRTDVETIDAEHKNSRLMYRIRTENDNLYRTLEAVNNVSIWRLIWSKLRRKKLIEWRT